MSVRTKLLSGRNINTDSDFSKYIETVSEPGVIEGLAVSTNSVAIGKCWCPCERTNGETIYALVESFSAETIDTSGTGYVIVTIGQNYIDDGSLINEDGTGVATFEVVSELPTKNYLLLATLTSGSITDSRNMIKKVGELNTAIESLTAYVNDINERVEALEEAGAIDHLEEQALVGERYNSTSQSMFVQKTPTTTNSTVEDCHVGDVAANTEIHIQRIANGEEANTLKLYAKMSGSPTTNLKVEVRKGVQVNVSNTEAYWYGDESEVLASGSVAYTSLSTSFAEIEFTLDNTISVDKGTLLDIVVYQESSGTKVVNSSNYYILGCDSTQWSEAFSFVSVNGSTRTRSKLMPYCISDSFAQSLLVKVGSDLPVSDNTTVISGGNSGVAQNSTIKKEVGTITPTSKATYAFSGSHYKASGIYLDNERLTYQDSNIDGPTTLTATRTLEPGNTYKVYAYATSSSSYWNSQLTNLTVKRTAILLKKEGLNGKPSSVVGIGKMGYIPFFGIINNELNIGEEVNTAIAGSITLGQAVGYLKLGKYKIPYYL